MLVYWSNSSPAFFSFILLHHLFLLLSVYLPNELLLLWLLKAPKGNFIVINTSSNKYHPTITSKMKIHIDCTGFGCIFLFSRFRSYSSPILLALQFIFFDFHENCMYVGIMNSIHELMFMFYNTLYSYTYRLYGSFITNFSVTEKSVKANIFSIHSTQIWFLFRSFHSTWYAFIGNVIVLLWQNFHILLLMMIKSTTKNMSSIFASVFSFLYRK